MTIITRQDKCIRRNLGPRVSFQSKFVSNLTAPQTCRQAWVGVFARHVVRLVDYGLPLIGRRQGLSKETRRPNET